jgi:predicted DNA-binding transcriptional regulator AlpA
MDSLLNQKQAARLLGLSVRTLERHRVAGTGPRWARLGRLVRYRQSDLTAWVESNLRASTSENVASQRPIGPSAS